MSRSHGSLSHAASATTKHPFASTVGTDAPLWILRHHAPSAIHAVRLLRLQGDGDAGKNSTAKTFVLAGDGQGRVSLTSLKDLRPLHFWKAHDQSVLGVDVVQLSTAKEATASTSTSASSIAIVTQGRDNKVNIFRLQLTDLFSSIHHVLPSRIQQDLPVPDKLASIDINALNYCPMSLLQRGPLLAVPHTLDSGYVDVLSLSLPFERLAKAVGKADIQSAGVSGASQRAPMCMTMHLLPPPSLQRLSSTTMPNEHADSSSANQDNFRLLAGYEDGYMRLWSVNADGSSTLEWSQREHSESIMASCVSQQTQTAYSVAADDRIVGYGGKTDAATQSAKCRSMGNASIAVRQDGLCIAVGGWDGVVRLYDDTLQHTASLRYHKETVQALSFTEVRAIRRHDGATKAVHVDSGSDDDDEDDDDDETVRGMNALGNVSDQDLLVTGGKEGRICLWRVDSS